MPTDLIVFLALTVAALVAVIVTGVSRRRNAHYAALVAHLALLFLAIRAAERHGADLVFEGAARTVRGVHMAGVAVSFAIVPLLVISGVLLARARGEGAEARRTWHRRAAWAYVVAVVITFGLGLAMTLLARPAS